MIYILFILGFILLIKGADYLVDGSSSVAKKYGISNIVIGLTIVAFGTSLPELIVNIFAATNGKPDLAIGNILGSNIVNIFFILGVSALIYPLVAVKNTVVKEIPFSLLAAVAVTLLASDALIDGKSYSELGRIDGLILLSFFAVFMYYITSIAKSDASNQEDYKVISTKASVISIAGGIALLVIGGNWIVDGAVHIASSLGISESLIGLTVLAIGTSLPELATSVVAAYKKNADIAIGNVIGSNIFNIFFILGVSALITPLPFVSSNMLDLVMVIIASLLLFAFMYIGKRHTLEKWQGVSMIVIYFTYIMYLVISR